MAVISVLTGIMLATSVWSESGRVPRSQAPTVGSLGPPPDGVNLRPLDGGAYPSGLPNDTSFFPIGVWLAEVTSPDQAAVDKRVGLNTYVAITANSDLAVVESSGMHLLAQVNEWAGTPHEAVDGWLVDDEADMTYGAGWDRWTGTEGWNTCDPAQDAGGRCGYTVMETMSGRVPPQSPRPLRYANYGMGVATWQTDRQAATFVNGPWQDVVSADVYYFTHPSTPEDQRKGARYGALVDRVRKLDARDGRRQPVWAFVEVGHPFTEETAPTVTAPQVRSAVWHSIIAGARGIVYFNHSFAGDVSANVLRDQHDPAMTPAVTEVNRQIHELAPVLNAPYADGYVRVVSGPARVMAKRGPDGAWYVFAAATTTGETGGEVELEVAAGSTVEVLDENRHVPVTGGRFVDRFADGNAVHVYRVT